MELPKHRNDIDGLRALAVGLVLLFHADLAFVGGFVGVDVGVTRAGRWCVVEATPPFALSSYDLDIGVYVEYCCAAWASLTHSAAT